MIKALLLLLALCLMSCASREKITWDEFGIGTLKNSDYADQLMYLSRPFENTIKDLIVQIDSKSILYLNTIHHRIVKNNEVFLEDSVAPRFVVFNHGYPIIFSLPGNIYYISQTLLSKFLKNEQMFIAALTREVIRSSRRIFKKYQVIVTELMTIEKMMQLMALPIEFKSRINEWTYIVLKRSGYDSSALLAWIQLQNKNSLDFSMQNLDKSILMKEEYFFKNFLVRERYSINEVSAKDEKNSSKEFYAFLKDIK